MWSHVVHRNLVLCSPGTSCSWQKCQMTMMTQKIWVLVSLQSTPNMLLIFTIHEFSKERDAKWIESFCLHSIQFLLFFDEILFFFQSILQCISKAGPLLLGMLGFEDTNTCWVHPSPAGTAGLYHKVLSFLSFYSFLCLVRFKHQNYLGKVVIVVCCRRVVFTLKLRKKWHWHGSEVYYRLWSNAGLYTTWLVFPCI